ncbi:helix-turn-helix transcriptional regulator [Paenibacillus methanolicus]|uniref:Putative molybdopterin biosynthesis protein n=1 Tax=Paenibacillus methanolicus TaxID=582686 RepID=A0A5S5CLD1_9BACL|nr:helix-turn-helix transcriptional regulator [Paenibacillus methanolicus]TYP79515.1 putative molybdopterin biosynthesis protein [Paenibacillus methanolicus]
MTNDLSYTTEEIAKLLKISKLTVYDLIKKGDLPAYRVGKQMRVDASDLERYKQRSKGLAHVGPDSLAASVRPESPSSPTSRRAHGASDGRLVITGQDVSLDILAKHIEKHVPDVRPLREHVGSLDSLIAMYRGESDIVSTHLLDGDTGQYNLPYIRKLLVGQPLLVVRLLSRPAGLYVQPGNPLGLSGWRDLGRPDIRLANREQGSGARVLLDEQLRLHGLAASAIAGYNQAEDSHLAVAGKVASGEANVGVGIAKAAAIVGGVEFIPLIDEQYDLVMLKKPEKEAWMQAVVKLLRSDALRQELRAIQGYDFSRTGEIIYEY